MDRYAVIGHPVDHSLSPRIHAAFAEQTGAAMAYGRIDPGRDGFAAAMRAFFAEGGSGLNVTVPFKAEAFAAIDRASPGTCRSGVVNTLSRDADGGVLGDNTDGIGLVRDLTARLEVSVRAARVLVLGAGGAVRGALPALLELAPAEVVIANRTPERAASLAAQFGDLGPLSGCGFADVPVHTGTSAGFDLVINASAASLGGALPPLDPAVLRPGATVYDMMYGDAAGPFLDWASQHGAGVVADGLGMLVEQAAESFFVWRGVRPDAAAVLRALRAA